MFSNNFLKSGVQKFGSSNKYEKSENEKFEFTSHGSVSISLSSISFTSSLNHPDPILFGFFLLSDDNLLQAVSHLSQNPNPKLNPNLSVLSSHCIRLLFTFKDLTFQSYYNTFSIPDKYLFLANCVSKSTAFTGACMEMFNLSNGQKFLLLIGMALVPSAYFLFCMCSFVFFEVWIWACLVTKYNVSHQIHYLMAWLFLTKAMNKPIISPTENIFPWLRKLLHPYTIIFDPSTGLPIFVKNNRNSHNFLQPQVEKFLELQSYCRNPFSMTIGTKDER